MLQTFCPLAGKANCRIAAAGRHQLSPPQGDGRRLECGFVGIRGEGSFTVLSGSFPNLDWA